MSFISGLVKSIIRSEVRDLWNKNRRWQCDYCGEMKSHRAQKYEVGEHHICTRCLRRSKPYSFTPV